MDLVETGCEFVDLTHLAQSSNECQFSTKDNFLPKQLLTSQEGFCSMAKEELEDKSKPGGRSFLYQKFSLGVTHCTKLWPF